MLGEGAFSCINTDVSMSTVQRLAHSPASFRVAPAGGIITLRRKQASKWAVFSLIHTPASFPQNRKHTYLCRGHLPAPACPLCGYLYKPGILLPCSPEASGSAPAELPGGWMLEQADTRAGQSQVEVHHLLSVRLQRKSVNTSRSAFLAPGHWWCRFLNRFRCCGNMVESTQLSKGLFYFHRRSRAGFKV